MTGEIHPSTRSSAEFGAGIAALRLEIANSMARLGVMDEQLTGLEGKLSGKPSSLEHLLIKLLSLPAAHRPAH